MKDILHIEDYFDLGDEEFAEALGCKVSDIEEAKKQLILAQKLPPKRVQAFENTIRRMKTVRPAFLERLVEKEMDQYRRQFKGAFGARAEMQNDDPEGVLDGPYGAE